MTKSLPLTLIASALFLGPIQTVSADHGTNFHCSGFPVKSVQGKAALKNLAHNQTMKNIVLEYVFLWEDEEIKNICDAAAVGKTADLGCLDGRRNWQEIQSRIPDGLKGKSNKDLQPLMLKLQQARYQTSSRNKVLDYCQDLGIIDRSVKG